MRPKEGAETPAGKVGKEEVPPQAALLVGLQGSGEGRASWRVPSHSHSPEPMHSQRRSTFHKELLTLWQSQGSLRARVYPHQAGTGGSRAVPLSEGKRPDLTTELKP